VLSAAPRRRFADPEGRGRLHFSAPDAAPGDLPYLAVGEPDRRDALAHLADDRDEDEIVVLSEAAMRIMSVTALGRDHP
jgi:hypothetical protein